MGELRKLPGCDPLTGGMEVFRDGVFPGERDMVDVAGDVSVGDGVLDFREIMAGMLSKPVVLGEDLSGLFVMGGVWLDGYLRGFPEGFQDMLVFSLSDKETIVVSDEKRYLKDVFPFSFFWKPGYLGDSALKPGLADIRYRTGTTESHRR